MESFGAFTIVSVKRQSSRRTAINYVLVPFILLWPVWVSVAPIAKRKLSLSQASNRIPSPEAAIDVQQDQAKEEGNRALVPLCT